MIATQQELNALIERALAAPRVALDTEFFWERTYYPILATVQLGFSETDCHLIDAVALPTLPGFGRLLASPTTEKILHDAQQDLAILSRITETAPANIFDTRRAAGFAAMESTLSLANLLKKVLNIEIEKTETRSNWLKRPLTPSQIAYALNDVRFLPELRDTLVQQAEQKQNLDRLREEMQIYNDPELYRDQTPEQIFKRTKAGRINGQQATVLMELIRWREEKAKTKNMPRNFILRNNDMIALAHEMPQTPESIRQIKNLPRSATGHNAKQLTRIINNALSAPPLPVPQRQARLSAETKNRIANYIKQVHARARDAALDPALIGSKATLTKHYLQQQEAQQPTLFPSTEATPPPTNWRTEFLKS